MLRRTLFLAVWIAAIISYRPFWAAGNVLIPETTAARHALTRPWFAQVEVDQSRGRISDAILCDGVLYVQTDTAMIHAIDAETGKTLWSGRVGRSDHPSMVPDARGKLLAVVNGSRLYLVDRFNGKLIHEMEIKDAPGGGPAVSSQRIYVPMVSGMVVAYSLSFLDEPKHKTADETKDRAVKEENDLDLERKANEPPLFCRSYGRALVQPLVTRDDPVGEYVVWPTDRGYFNFARINREKEGAFVLKFRLETGAKLVSRPAYLPADPKVLGDSGLVFAVSGDGFVYAVKEENGETLWRFSTGEPILQSPAVVGNRVFVATQLGGMYCLETKTGENLWWTPGVIQFVAAGKDRVYAADRFGRLLTLDAASGARVDSLPTDRDSFMLTNTDTDRIYLIGRQGLIQCLHDVEQTKPLLHDMDRKAAAKAGPKPTKQKPAEKKEAEKEEKEKADNPFL